MKVGLSNFSLHEISFYLLYHNSVICLALSSNIYCALRPRAVQENPCSSVQDVVGFPSLGITESLIPAHLTILDENECYSSSLGSDEKSITLCLDQWFWLSLPLSLNPDE